MPYIHPHTSKHLTVAEESRLRELLNYIKMTRDNEKSNKWVAEAVDWVDNLVWRRIPIKEQKEPVVSMFDTRSKDEILDNIIK